jgi:L-seryl-tRNA(Ser) seleniumtransferase
VGRADLVARLKRNPLYRTMRVDKITYAIMQRLLSIYLDGSHTEDIRLWSLLAVPESELYRRARAILEELGAPEGLSVTSTEAFVGGGALPESGIPSVGIVFSKDYPATALMRRFRRAQPPIIGRVEKDEFLLDLRSVPEEDLRMLTAGIRSVLAGMTKGEG